jgi:hypothetical protein
VVGWERKEKAATNAVIDNIVLYGVESGTDDSLSPVLVSDSIVQTTDQAIGGYPELRPDVYQQDPRHATSTEASPRKQSEVWHLPRKAVILPCLVQRSRLLEQGIPE